MEDCRAYMRKLIILFILLNFNIAYADWKFNPFTGKMDYYEAGSNADITDWTAHNSYPAACSAGQFVTTIGDTNTCAAPSWTVSVTFIIDGAGSVISTGEKGFLEIPFAFTITGWTIAADQSGSIVVDVWKDTYANFPPTVADTIAGSEKITLSTAQINQDLSLGTWTTSVSAGDILLIRGTL
jgi:hypothetical protein